MVCVVGVLFVGVVGLGGVVILFAFLFVRVCMFEVGIVFLFVVFMLMMVFRVWMLRKIVLCDWFLMWLGGVVAAGGACGASVVGGAFLDVVLREVLMYVIGFVVLVVGGKDVVDSVW